MIRTACWLMHLFSVDEALTGDLIERRRTGRSAIWFWQQTVMAVAARVASAVHSDPIVVGVVGVTVAVDIALPYVWMHFLTPYVILPLHFGRSPTSINWLATSLPRALFQIVVFLHPWEWSGGTAWCALLAMMAWCLVGIWPKRATLISATFVLTNVCQTLPYLERSFLDSSHDSFNPVWASNFIWYAFFTLVAIPVSISLGGGGALRPRRPRASS
jgi:hypothetical protein